MSLYQPLPDDFLPLPETGAAQRITRPSLSYWQDAWRRLKQNPRALASLAIIISLVLFTAFGPAIWRIDPAHQELDQTSRPPNFGSSALVVADYVRWDGIVAEKGTDLFYENKSVPFSLAAPGAIELADEPTTEIVRLHWSPVPGATGYAVYRHELEPSGINDLGLPLGEVDGGDHVSYEDRLGLEAQAYYYSVVPTRDGESGTAYTTLKIILQQAIALAEAKYRGLLPADADSSRIGTRIRLGAHPLGTDYLGRDMLARIIHGARTSLYIGVTAPFLYVLFGLMYGGVAGYLGGRVDDFMMRFADFVIALPFLLFMILFKVAFGIGPGESGIGPMLVALVLLGWPSTARLVRGQVLQIREEPYVQAARLMGAGTAYLIYRHMLPNVMGVLLVSLSFAIPSAIFTEAFLSFIGMGVAPPTPSWGSMCNDGIRTMLSYPHELIAPAAFISVTVLAFNMLGDGLRDALDARMRSK